MSYWLTSARDFPSESAENAIRRLVGEEGIWGIRRKRNVQAGDSICFYVAGRKVFVARAVVASQIAETTDSRLRAPVEHPWVFSLREPRFFAPIRFDAQLRAKLGGLAEVNPGGYVQGTKKVTQREFELMTGESPGTPAPSLGGTSN